MKACIYNIATQIETGEETRQSHKNGDDDYLNPKGKQRLIGPHFKSRFSALMGPVTLSVRPLQRADVEGGFLSVCHTFDDELISARQAETYQRRECGQRFFIDLP